LLCYPFGWRLGEYFHLITPDYYQFNAYTLFVHVIAIVISFIGFNIVFSHVDKGGMLVTIVCSGILYLWGYYAGGWYMVTYGPLYFMDTVYKFFQTIIL
jgi:hypothetical protein